MILTQTDLKTMKRSIWGCWGAENELCHWSPGWCQPSPQAHEPSRCLPAQGRGKTGEKKNTSQYVSVEYRKSWPEATLWLCIPLSLCIRARFAHSWRVTVNFDFTMLLHSKVWVDLQAESFWGELVSGSPLPYSQGKGKCRYQSRPGQLDQFALLQPLSQNISLRHLTLVDRNSLCI